MVALTMALLFGGLAAAGCASKPQVRVDKAPAANLSSYRTFSFYERLSTDKPSYTSIMSARLKQATRDELERRGYVYSERDSDLKVNFNLRVADRQEVRSYPTNGGVFLRRAGLSEVDVIQYRQGTVSVDLIDHLAVADLPVLPERIALRPSCSAIATNCPSGCLTARLLVAYTPQMSFLLSCLGVCMRHFAGFRKGTGDPTI